MSAAGVIAVDDEVGEQQPALTSGKLRFESFPIALDNGGAAELDPQPRHRRQGHANILAMAFA